MTGSRLARNKVKEGEMALNQSVSSMALAPHFTLHGFGYRYTVYSGTQADHASTVLMSMFPSLFLVPYL